MAVVPRKRTKGKVTYYVTYLFDGKKVWERVGSDRREAHRLNRVRKTEIAEGRFRPGAKQHPTVREFAETWLSGRKCRWANDEATYLRTYVLSRPWFAGLYIEDLENRHMLQLVDELDVAWSKRFKRTISPKTVSSIYSIVVTMCRKAQSLGLLRIDPCKLEKDRLQRRSGTKRKAYSIESVVNLLSCPDVHPTGRVFAALALLTGMREGEACGRRWRDWDRVPKPLGSLLVDSQYEDQPLKGDKRKAGEVARKVPVHPELARLLEWWWSEGFALTHCRPPTPDDFIVPNDAGEVYGRSAAYALFQRAIKKAGVANLTLHSTRHTFITLCRRGGARKDVLEQVTHNASGDTLDEYTHWDWAPLCEAVLCLRLAPAQVAPPALPVAGARVAGDVSGDVISHESCPVVAPPGFEPGITDVTLSKDSSDVARAIEHYTPEKQAFGRISAAEGDARHQVHQLAPLPPGLVAVRVEIGASSARTEVLPGDTVGSLTERVMGAGRALLLAGVSP